MLGGRYTIPGDIERIYDYRLVSIEHVSGACQCSGGMLRAIGGICREGRLNRPYSRNHRQMKGWKTRAFTTSFVCTTAKWGRQVVPSEQNLKWAQRITQLGTIRLGVVPNAYQIPETIHTARSRLGQLSLGVNAACGQAGVARIDCLSPQEQMHRLTRVFTARGCRAKAPHFHRQRA